MVEDAWKLNTMIKQHDEECNPQSICKEALKARKAWLGWSSQKAKTCDHSGGAATQERAHLSMPPVRRE